MATPGSSVATPLIMSFILCGSAQSLCQTCSEEAPLHSRMKQLQPAHVLGHVLHSSLRDQELCISVLDELVISPDCACLVESCASEYKSGSSYLHSRCCQFYTCVWSAKRLLAQSSNVRSVKQNLTASQLRSEQGRAIHCCQILRNVVHAYLPAICKMLYWRHKGHHTHAHASVNKLVMHCQHLLMAQLGCCSSKPLLCIVPIDAAGQYLDMPAQVAYRAGLDPGIHSRAGQQSPY